jgi:hypothetical protein
VLGHRRVGGLTSAGTDAQHAATVLVDEVQRHEEVDRTADVLDAAGRLLWQGRTEGVHCYVVPAARVGNDEDAPGAWLSGGPGRFPQSSPVRNLDERRLAHAGPVTVIADSARCEPSDLLTDQGRHPSGVMPDRLPPGGFLKRSAQNGPQLLLRGSSRVYGGTAARHEAE